MGAKALLIGFKLRILK